MKPDFLLVGAGVVGLATALELADRGAKVLVLERGEVGGESSWAGGGILSLLLPWDYSGPVQQLADYSCSLYPAWIKRLRDMSGMDPEYLDSGLLVLPPYEHSHAVQWCTKHQQPWQIRLGTEFGLARDTGLGMWLASVSQVRNPRLVRTLLAAARACGVEVRERVSVLDWVRSGRRIERVYTSDGTYRAGGVVLTAGAWSGRVPPVELLRGKVYPVRGQMLLFKVKPRVLKTVIYRDGRYLIPRKDGHVLAGSTLERVGYDRSTTDVAQKALLAFASSLVPSLNADVLVRHWSGLRPGSKGNLPFICRHPDYANLFVNTGHYRYGVTLAPGTARLLVQQIEEADTDLPIMDFQMRSQAGNERGTEQTQQGHPLGERGLV